jgi:hypothetical protein
MIAHTVTSDPALDREISQSIPAAKHARIKPDQNGLVL